MKNVQEVSLSSYSSLTGYFVPCHFVACHLSSMLHRSQPLPDVNNKHIEHSAIPFEILFSRCENDEFHTVETDIVFFVGYPHVVDKELRLVSPC